MYDVLFKGRIVAHADSLVALRIIKITEYTDIRPFLRRKR